MYAFPLYQYIHVLSEPKKEINTFIIETGKATQSFLPRMLKNKASSCSFTWASSFYFSFHGSWLVSCGKGTIHSMRHLLGKELLETQAISILSFPLYGVCGGISYFPTNHPDWSQARANRENYKGHCPNQHIPISDKRTFSLAV